MHTVIHYEGFGRKKFCLVSLVNDFSCFFQYFRPKFDASLKFAKNTPKNCDEERKTYENMFVLFGNHCLFHCAWFICNFK